MDKVYESPVFQMADVDLKFSKPEVRIEVNRDKANLLGVSTRRHRPDAPVRIQRPASSATST